MPITTVPTRKPFAPPFFSTFANEVDQLQANVRRMFDNPFLAFENASFVQPIGWMPAVEVAETEELLTLTAELPGLDREDVHVGIEGDMLTIRGEKREERHEDGKLHLAERNYGFFRRTFALPAFVDKEKITAEFVKGVLVLKLPKGMEAKIKGREIPIVAK